MRGESNQYKDSGHVVTEIVIRGRVEKCAFGEDSGLEDPGGGGCEEMVQALLGNCSLNTQ
jgi:hypothetical protein